MEFNPKTVVKKMQADNRLFISERDLQVNFIIYARELYPELKFLPEYSYTDSGENSYRIDLMITDGNEFVAMEFKYVTANSVISIPGNDNYPIKNHSAIDIRRHQCVKDISRLEAYKGMTNVKYNCGYLLLITNDKSFWMGSDGTKAGKHFDIREGFNLSVGIHAFDDNFTVAKTHKPIELKDSYITHYDDYVTNYKEEKESKKHFKYLLLKV